MLEGMIYTTIKCGGKIDGYCTQQTIGSSSNYAAASVYHVMKASISRLLTTAWIDVSDQRQ